MLKSLYDRVFKAAESSNAPYWLAIVSFAESSFFPIPPDVMLAPMAMAKPHRAMWYALICTIASVLGALLGYAIGAFAYESIGSLIVSPAKLDQFRAWYQDWGAALILVKGVLPIPFKLITIASGVAGYSLFWFVILCLITRGARFFAVAGLFNYLGPTGRQIIEQNATAVTVGVVAAVIGGFVLIHYLG
jgi:membrane protein YqaA with SNARE-associated domain